MITKYNKFLLLLAFGSILFSSCNDEMEIVNTPEDTEQETENTDKDKTEIVYKTLVITASANGTATRTSYEETGNTIKAFWSEDDFIYVGSPNTGLTEEVDIDAENSGFTKFTIKSLSEDKKTASFEGTVAVAQNTTKILAFYGDANYIKVNKEGVKLNFDTQSQSINTLNDIEKYELMTASAELSTDETQNISLAFNHENAVFKLNVGAVSNVEKFDELTISFPDNQELGFYSNVTFNTDGTKTFGSPVNSLKVKLGDGKGSGAEFSAYCLLRTTEISAASKFNIKAIESKASGDYTYSYNLKVSSPIIENKFYYTPKLNLAIDNTLAGEGTEVSPYIIDNVEKLKGLNNTSGIYYQLSRDLDFTNIAFTPITTFEGSLDGNGKTISNLTFTVGDGNGGIFSVNNGTIKNLNITDATVTKNGSLDNNGGTGILVGVNNNKISNCIINSSELSASLTSIGTDIGIGLLVGTNNTGKTISECTVNASDLSISGSKKCYAGGLVGYNFTGNIEFSFVKSATNITYTSTEAEANIGGLIGRNKGGTIKGCSTNINIITNEPDVTLKIAGFIGDAFYGGTTTIEGCYTTGSLTFREKQTYGGFTGSLGGGGTKTLTNCYTSIEFNPKTDHAFSSSSNAVKATNCYFIKGSQSTPITNVESATANDLKGKLGIFNNLNWDNYEFAIGANNDEPLIIQKKQ